MATPEEIRQKLFLTNPDATTVESFDRALEEGIFKVDTCSVLDVAGKPLVAKGIYAYNKPSEPVRIKICHWEYGAGNILDRFCRVYYTDNNLNDSFLVVDARYPKGVFGGAVYQSTLVKVEK